MTHVEPPPPGDSLYPVPTAPPTYHLEQQRRPKSHGRLYSLLDGAFVAVGLILTFYFAFALLTSGLSFSWHGIILLVAFWGVLAYVALPRLHQLLTTFYLPDYFLARTKTGDGLLGDPVNLAIMGSEEDVHYAMRAAGWIQADPITLRSSLGIIKSSVMKTSYPEAPVSNLYLFERTQNFAYQQEVDGNAAQRHHVRFWKAPEGWELPGGQSVDWMAAGTYDVRVGLSSWTLQITHKIDANIDAERDYIIDTVRYCDPATRVDILPRFTPAFHDKNGGGDAVHTDGNMPILDLRGAAQRSNQAQVHEHTAMPSVVLPQAEQQLDKELPPKGLAMAGLLIAIKSVLALGAIGVAAFGTHSLTAIDNVPMFAATAFTLEVVLTALMLLAWWSTVRKSKVARLLLLVVVLFTAAVEFSGISLSTHPSLPTFSDTGLTLLILLSLTAPEVRQWVSSQHQSASNR